MAEMATPTRTDLDAHIEELIDRKLAQVAAHGGASRRTPSSWRFATFGGPLMAGLLAWGGVSLTGLNREMGETKAEVKALRETLQQHQQQTVASFERVDARLEGVDARLEQIDARFEQIDARFERVDARFAQVEARLARVDEGMAKVATAITELRTEVRGRR